MTGSVKNPTAKNLLAGNDRPLPFSSDLKFGDDVTRIRVCPDTRAPLYAYAIAYLWRIGASYASSCIRVYSNTRTSR